MVTSAQTDKDPMLLGVSVPLGVTISAAKEISTAWREFGVNLFQAIKSQKDAMGKSKGAMPASKSENHDGAASSSAGVSA
jgi:hypothetical protein